MGSVVYKYSLASLRDPDGVHLDGRPVVAAAGGLAVAGDADDDGIVVLQHRSTRVDLLGSRQ